MSKRKSAAAADEFGTTDWESEFEQRPQSPRNADRDYTREQAHEELNRLINRGELQPLNGRKPIEHDWMMDAPGWEEFNGPKPKGPSIAERQQLHREYGGEIDRIMASPKPQPQPREAMPKTAEETAELLFREFSATYPELAKDASRLEEAAKTVIQAGGFDFSRRSDFYRRVAAELSS